MPDVHVEKIISFNLILHFLKSLASDSVQGFSLSLKFDFNLILLDFKPPTTLVFTNIQITFHNFSEEYALFDSDDCRILSFWYFLCFTMCKLY